jgi:hypothetical protein
MYWLRKNICFEDFFKSISMAEIIETENNHAGFIAVHVGRLNRN